MCNVYCSFVNDNLVSYKCLIYLFFYFTSFFIFCWPKLEVVYVLYTDWHVYVLHTVIQSINQLIQVLTSFVTFAVEQWPKAGGFVWGPWYIYV